MAKQSITAILTACVSLCSGLAAASTDLDNPDVVEAFVDGLVIPLMKNNNSPSGTVAIAKDGELIFAKGYGYQDVEKRVPVDPHTTLFRPGSVSKLFTWAAVMQMAEQGKLDLDTDVNTYLDGFQIDDTWDRPVTLRDILTHTPGFEEGGMGYLIIDDPAKARPLKEAMARYQPYRINPPGAQTSYSNYGTALAGLIVSNVSGLSFNEYLEKNIFEPLGMERSSFREPLPDSLAADMAAGYAVENGKYVEKPFEIISSFGPAGAMSGTSPDLVRFGQAMLNGGELDGVRIMKEATVREMLTRNFSHDDRLMGMALGFYEIEENGHRLVGHGGDTAWFHSYLGIDPSEDLTFFVSFSGLGGGAVRSAFTPAFYDRFYPMDEQPPVPPEDFSERAAKYAGKYGFWRSNFSKLEKALGSLAGGLDVIPTEDNTLSVGMGGKFKQYVEVDENLFRELDPGISILPGISPRLIAFQQNDQGQITGFIMDGLPFMSTRKLPAIASPGLNAPLLGISLLLMLGVLLRRFFQRSMIRAMPAGDRSAVNAAAYASGANWLTVIVGAIVLTAVGDQLSSTIPLALKLWLVLPIVATLAGLSLAWRCIGMWKDRLLPGVWARIRYTVVTLAGLFMCWFYYYWNILGWQYYT